MPRDLEIRPLRPEEIERFVQFSHYTFAGRSPEQRRVDFAGRVRPERDILVAFEAGEIVSQVMIYEFQVWIDGVRYPTGGLANVATAPEQARRGYARQVLRASFRWMRDELGQCLSTLYPTVFPLYRGLGWTLADDSRQISGPPVAFRPNPSLPSDPEGQIVRRTAEAGDVDMLAPLYDAFARERSGYLDRPRWWWEARVLGLVRDDPSWIGRWYDSAGVLAGYVVYSFEGPSVSRLRVYEVVALRPEAYQGILTFLAAHNLTKEVVISAGRDVPWRSLVANPHLIQVEARDQANFMLRVVDFPRTIARRPAPNLAGLPPVALRVIDESAPWNQGTWRIQAGDRHWNATPDPEATPGATADISTIGALVSGFSSVAEAIELGTLRGDDGARPTLEALFQTRYPPTSRDHF
ncbi:MAG: GNAT family N-acetyltransferase [Chloroflexota bacterium]